MKCAICGKKCNGHRGLEIHLKSHKITPIHYYDTYIRSVTEGVCECGKDTMFINIDKGYTKYCSKKCYTNGIECQELFLNSIKGDDDES